MCLIISTTIHGFGKPEPKIAKEPIEVYKILYYNKLTNWYYTPVRHKIVIFEESLDNLDPYKFAVLQSKLNVKEFTVYEGIHAYKNKYTAFRWLQCYSMDTNFEFNIFKAIIPVGSKCYFGRNGDIVSNKLVIINEKLN